MNRRSFLGTVSAALAAARVPTQEVSRSLPLVQHNVKWGALEDGKRWRGIKTEWATGVYPTNVEEIADLLNAQAMTRRLTITVPGSEHTGKP